MSQAVASEEMSPSEVFSHKALTMDLCENKELFTMKLGGDAVDFKLCDLISFRRKVFAIDLSQLFEVDSASIEIIYLPHVDRHLLLSLEDLLNIRELLSGTFAVLQINSQVQRTLYNPFEGRIQA